MRTWKRLTDAQLREVVELHQAALPRVAFWQVVAFVWLFLLSLAVGGVVYAK